MKFWILIDNAADTFQIYPQAAGDPAPVQLKYGATTNFAFYHPASLPIEGVAAVMVGRVMVQKTGSLALRPTGRQAIMAT